ncbi:MAG: pyridoxal phosphate-dependent aminotransferase [Eubacteriales bacterium]|nr:pyridoxal phosphate-dependent aminotransferase [Eubacteriales bacterium]
MEFVASQISENIQPSATLKLNALVQEMRSQGQDVIGLSAGEPDFDTPTHIKDAAIKALNEGKTHYTPVGGIGELKQAICKTLLRDKNLCYQNKNILVSMGAKQALYEALHVILDPGDEVLLPMPCWLSYQEMIGMCGALVVPIPSKAENAFMPDIKDFYDRCTNKTKLIIINSPNNPTGAVWNRELLNGIAEFAKEKGLYIISDEIYEKLVYDGFNHVSIAQISEDAQKRSIVISGFSKAYAMTGWRLGYIAADEKIISAINAYQSHAAGCTNSVAQYAAVAALEGTQQPLGEMLKIFNKRRDIVVNLLEKMPYISFVRPHGAFYVLIDISKCIGKSYKGTPIHSDEDFAYLLLTHGRVSVVPGKPFGAPNNIRISYATKEDTITEAMQRLKSFLETLD